MSGTILGHTLMNLPQWRSNEIKFIFAIFIMSSSDINDLHKIWLKFLNTTKTEDGENWLDIFLIKYLSLLCGPNVNINNSFRTEWNEVESDGFFTNGMATQQTALWENWHLERGFKLLRTFGLVRWGLGGSSHVESTGVKLSFASQAAR
ncbi:lysosomal-trafficking regulator [Trichonephila inaurata madagascariensis]|uniref:Lysosomal-trafficking regulator n=1 Tax=Trichonephila inaurata madagascariensis TaxID=2747483 RepID=A0A8X7BPB6_9ARAC|nr:lysosomal-trafficking regulator [Trichonephila inaurata madagascariensis]